MGQALKHESTGAIPIQITTGKVLLNKMSLKEEAQMVCAKALRFIFNSNHDHVTITLEEPTHSKVDINAVLLSGAVSLQAEEIKQLFSHFIYGFNIYSPYPSVSKGKNSSQNPRAKVNWHKP